MQVERDIYDIGTEFINFGCFVANLLFSIVNEYLLAGSAAFLRSIIWQYQKLF